MIINIISEYSPVVGGGGILAEELVKRLLEKGHCVNVITWGAKTPSAKNTCEVSRSRSSGRIVDSSEVEGSNLTIYLVGGLNQISPFQKLKFGYLAGKKARGLKGVVHGHTFFFPLDKKRTIYTFHATQLGILRALERIKNKSASIFISTVLKKLYLIWEKYIIRHSSKLIAVSQTVKKELLELGAKPEQIEVMSNPINLRDYHRVDLNRKNGKDTSEVGGCPPRRWRKNERLIFAIGRLSPIKGFQDLIKAVSLFKDEDIKLLIAGKGGYRQTLVQLVKKLKLTRQIVFLGKIPRKEVKKYYSLADVTVVPSLYDAFGLVLLEAMACGSPLVCTRVCDFPRIAGQAALYAQPQNPKDLAEKIQSVLDHPQKAKKMTEYGLKKVKNYNWKPYIIKLEKLYQETFAQQ